MTKSHQNVAVLRTWGKFGRRLDRARVVEWVAVSRMLSKAAPIFKAIAGESNDRQVLSLIFEVMKSKLAKFFVMEKAKGRLQPEAHEERLADFCIALIQGAMLMGKIKRKSHPGETTVHEAMKHIQRYMVPPSGSGQREESRGSPKTH